MHGKIAILIIVLAGNVSCIRNANGNDANDGKKQYISVKLKNFFPSKPLKQSEGTQEPPQISARVTSSSGFRPSQMLELYAVGCDVQ
ncbi:GL22718 [Drosophila persimilis]|uniref:GL22718 n=1 Tax=Drosophila persimilis TaxID=7234 RepID=B4GZV2_DROPE|nr:GL22718 [Drosophila persimilis]